MYPSDEADELARAQRGDRDAFRLLVRRHARAVYWIARGILSNDQDAEDVVQETFVLAWQKLADLEVQHASLLPWFAASCRYLAANQRRTNLRRVHDPLPEDNPDPFDLEQTVIARGYAESILGEVALLDDTDREIFLLCTVEAHSYAEAAEILGLSHGSIRNRLTRTKARLRAVADPQTDQTN